MIVAVLVVYSSNYQFYNGITLGIHRVVCKIK